MDLGVGLMKVLTEEIPSSPKRTRNRRNTGRVPQKDLPVLNVFRMDSLRKRLTQLDRCGNQLGAELFSRLYLEAAAQARRPRFLVTGAVNSRVQMGPWQSVGVGRMFPLDICRWFVFSLSHQMAPSSLFWLRWYLSAKQPSSRLLKVHDHLPTQRGVILHLQKCLDGWAQLLC